MNIKKNTGEPVYLVIAKSLKEMIIKGVLNPGNLLPSENYLVNQFEASRETVRKSLKSLETEGYIHSQPGKGYYVSTPKHNQFLLNFAEESENLQAKFKNITVIYPTLEVQLALGIGEKKKKVIEISKTLWLKGELFAYDLKYLPYDKGQPSIESEINYAVFPDIAAAKTAPFAFYTKMEITAETASAPIQKILNCSSDTSLLVVSRFIMGRDEDIIGYGKQYILPNQGKLIGYSGYQKDPGSI